jgi:hypothetical protein
MMVNRGARCVAMRTITGALFSAMLLAATSVKVGNWSELQSRMESAGAAVVVFELDVDFEANYTTQINVDGAGRDYTVEGNGHIIDAGTLGRFFTVQHLGSLTLRNMTLRNGKAVGGYYDTPEVPPTDCYTGRCINKGMTVAVRSLSTLTLEDCVIDRPEEITTYGRFDLVKNDHRGAIMSDNFAGLPIINIYRCYFYKIKTTWGSSSGYAAVESEGTLTIVDSTFEECEG